MDRCLQCLHYLTWKILLFHLVLKFELAAHSVQILYGLVLHSVKVGAGVLQQCTKDEGEADAQVNIYGLNEAVGIGQRSAGAHHQSSHGQNCSHSCGID